MPPELANLMKPDCINLSSAEPTLAFMISGLETVLAKNLSDAMASFSFGNPSSWMFTLLLIARHPGIRPSNLAEMLFQDRSAVGRIIDLLQAQTYVRRERSPKDGRVQELHLTVAGSEIAAEMDKMLQVHSAAFFSNLSPSEVQRLTDILRRVYRQRVLIRYDQR